MLKEYILSPISFRLSVALKLNIIWNFSLIQKLFLFGKMLPYWNFAGSDVNNFPIKILKSRKIQKIDIFCFLRIFGKTPCTRRRRRGEGIYVVQLFRGCTYMHACMRVRFEWSSCLICMHMCESSCCFPFSCSRIITVETLMQMFYANGKISRIYQIQGDKKIYHFRKSEMCLKQKLNNA